VPPVYFSALQAAYDDAIEGDTIQSQAWHLPENLSFDRNISITLKGGYDSLFTNNPSATTINGTLTISEGSVIVDNIVIR
jgi:hypothetical protein